MAKFSEKELPKKLEKYKKVDLLEIVFSRGIDGNIVLKNATVDYEYENGFINIESQNGNIKINTALVSEFKTTDNKISLSLDSLVIKLQ